MEKRATIIFNPKASGSTRIEKIRLAELAKKYGWRGEWKEASRYEEIATLADEAVKKWGGVIVAGGDGSVRAALKQVAGRGELGIIPLGTGNMLANYWGLGGKPLEEQIKLAVEGAGEEMDVGRANGQYFAVAMTVGATVKAMKVSRREKRRWGVGAYIKAGLKAMWGRPMRVRVEIDGVRHKIRARGVVVTNLGRVSGITLVPQVTGKSGNFGVVVLAPLSLWGWGKLIIKTALGRAGEQTEVVVGVGKKVKIELPGRKRKFECDGEIIGATKVVEVDMAPEKIKVRGVKGEGSADARKWLIFDFDGTLADTQKILVKIFNQLAPKYGINPVEPEQAELFRHMGVLEVIEKLGISKWRLPLMLVEGKAEFAKQLEKVEIFEGIRESLIKLIPKYRLGIVTSNEKASVEEVLRRHNLQIFEFVFSEKNIFGKGAVIKDLLREKGIKAEEVIYIGDEVRDIEAARASGVKAVAVGWGFNSVEILTKHQPDKVIDKVSDLVEL